MPWRILKAAGHETVFATPDGGPASADPRMLTGAGLGIWKGLLRADSRGREAHAELIRDSAFLNPLSYSDLDAASFDAAMLPGGHAPGMRVYLESPRLQSVVASIFSAGKPLAAICHGVVLASRARRPDGNSILHGYRTTALTRAQELIAWNLTRAWLGDYYRTYPTPVQDEVTSALASEEDFVTGPIALARDRPGRLGPGFVVRDRHYLSARWPGDAHRFGQELVELLSRGV